MSNALPRCSNMFTFVQVITTNICILLGFYVTHQSIAQQKQKENYECL